MEKMDSQNAKGEHYNLRWTNYHNNLSQIVLEHHLNEKLVDVTLVCEGQYIKVHKLVLSACSNFFQDMLFKMNSSQDQVCSGMIHPFIVMNGVQFNYLKHIVDFMYQGEIKVIDSDLEGVLALGESLRVKGLCSVKLRQKIGLNESKERLNESKEISNSPVTHQTKQTLPGEPKILPDDTKDSSKAPPIDTTLPTEEINSSISQEEPKNYSKVTLDALAETRTVTQYVNNGTKERTNEDREKVIKEPPLRGQPMTLNEEPKYKRFKVNPPPLVIRKSDIISPTTSRSSEHSQKFKVKEEKLEQMVSDVSKPLIIDAEKSYQDKKNEIPRPPNAFMIFATEMRKKLAVEHPEESSKDISIRLRNLWQTLSPETKETYYQAAQAALKEHELKYPQSALKPAPIKLKKIYVASFATSKSLEPSMIESSNEQGDDDLEIIEPPDVPPTIRPDST